MQKHVLQQLGHTCQPDWAGSNLASAWGLLAMRSPAEKPMLWLSHSAGACRKQSIVWHNRML